jgi:hypothetical protein
MSYYIPACPTPPAPVCNPCSTKELGRVRGVALINQSLYITNPDWEDPNVWINGITAGTIYMFPYTNGEVGVTPKMSNDYGSVPEGVDSYEYDMKIAEPQIQNNLPFWNAAQQARNMIPAYVTETLLWIGASTAMISPSAPVTNTITDKVDIKVEVKWIQASTIVPVAQPTGVFTQCID